MLTSEEKRKAIDITKKHDNDVGSSQVQISMLTERIQKLTEHLKINKKDKHSNRGLLNLLAKRRRHISYLKSKDFETYKEVIEKLGIRR